MSLDVIEPYIFAKTKRIKAFFTLKNTSFGKKEAEIKGFNLGFNTQDDPEIIEANRHHLIDTFNLDSNWIAFANQVHSNRVKVVADEGTFAETDGLITQVPGLALAIQVADCAAVLLADSDSQTVAAVHAGWRGAAGNIVPRTMEKMDRIGAKLERCKAFIGPCISLQYFEVGQEVAQQFPDEFVDYNTFNKPHIDLKGFLVDQLKHAGIPDQNIEVHSGCTIEEERFYSYRREKEQSGRMMAIIQLREGAF